MIKTAGLGHTLMSDAKMHTKLGFFLAAMQNSTISMTDSPCVEYTNNTSDNASCDIFCMHLVIIHIGQIKKVVGPPQLLQFIPIKCHGNLYSATETFQSKQ